MARALRILFWAAFMALGTFLIIDGKSYSVPDRRLQHLFWGAVFGAFLGYLFSRNLKRTPTRE
jgi:hypothetical protein